jgi:glycosyltransferase involved in cell wall biosynthesis
VAGRDGVLLVVEQLRSRIPGGIGTYARGLLQGLTTCREAGTALPDIRLHASRPDRRPDPLAAAGWPVAASALPGPLLSRAWDRGIVTPSGRWGEVVHAVSLAFPPPGRRPLVVTVHDLAWRSHPEAFPAHGRRWHEQALARALREADAFVVPSEAVGIELAEAGAGTRVVVVPHGADHLPPPDHRAAGKLLARVGVEGPFVLAVGTVEPRKNLTGLVAAHREAGARGGLVPPLVVVGPQGWGPGLEPAPGVVPVGSVGGETLAALYASAELLAYVPLAEGFGLPPLEAMAAGTAVLASPLPWEAEGMVVVDAEDVGAMADALVALLEDPERRRALGAAGREEASRRTWAAAAARHAALWQELARTGRRGKAR